MKCPGCSCELQERRVGATGRACSCGICGGVWLPFGSIEAGIARLGELADALPAAPAPAPVRPAGEQRLKCPECGGDMVAVRSGEARGVVMRTCLVCFSRWVGGADLAGLRKRGLLSRILDILRRNRPSTGPAAGTEGATGSTPQGAPGEESVRTAPPGEDTRE